MVHFDGSGEPFIPKYMEETGYEEPTWDQRRFDDSRNWALVEAWLTDPNANVLMVFVAKHVEERMVAHAILAGAPPALRARASEVMIQPKGALPHDNHFHVRITCPRGQRDCQNFGQRKQASVVRARPKTSARPAVATRAAKSRPRVAP